MRFTKHFTLLLVASASAAPGANAQFRQDPAGRMGDEVSRVQTLVTERDSTITTLLTGPLGTRSPTGTVTISGTSVRLELADDKPGTTRVWHIHHGTCTHVQGVVGGSDTYPTIATDAKGGGHGVATLPAPLSNGEGYVVDVHDTTVGASLGVIACGTISRAPVAIVQQGDATTGNMAGMEESQSMSDSASSMGHTSAIPTDSLASLLMAVYQRMMADPVIRERAATDPVLRRLTAQLRTQEEITSAGAMPAMNMPGATTGQPPAPNNAATTKTSTKRPPASPKSARKPAAKPSTKPVSKPATPQPDHSKMPGMNMPGMGKP